MAAPRDNTPRTLIEACRCAHTWALSSSRRSGLDRPEDDHVKRYEEFRRQCPDRHRVEHAAFCERCDNSYPMDLGGAQWLRNQGWRQINPFEKFPEPLKPRPALSDKIPPEMLKEHENQESNLFAGNSIKSKIEELPVQELSVPEDRGMSNDYVRDLLRMSGGGGLGGRERLSIPDELMDALAGDAAQEAIMKDKVLQEMRRQMTPDGVGGRFVDLDTMTESMEKGDVDEFLKNARSKIIKRSKSTRRGCCLKIGGILDQVMGPAGGEWADEKAVSDRGKSDPIGESEGYERFLKSKTSAESQESDDDLLVDFIAEEFSLLTAFPSRRSGFRVRSRSPERFGLTLVSRLVSRFLSQRRDRSMLSCRRRRKAIGSSRRATLSFSSDCSFSSRS